MVFFSPLAASADADERAIAGTGRAVACTSLRGRGHRACPEDLAKHRDRLLPARMNVNVNNNISGAAYKCKWY